MKKKSWFTLLLPFGALCLAICMFLFPQATYDGAKYGLETWAFTLLPSLLPFMIIADILIELGIVGFLGVLLEPLMRPLFKQPGEAGFVVAMGFTSGFPMGAILASSLYEKKICTKNEATRLITFTNNASPLFLLVAVPIGMLGLPQLGIVLLIAHYASNLIIGILSRFFADSNAQSPSTHQIHCSIILRSINQLLQARHENPLPLGTILSNGIAKGLKNICSIGGFVVFFSVLISILDYIHIFTIFDFLFAQLLHTIHFSPVLSTALSHGMFEMTLGSKSVALTSAPVLEKLIMISFLLGWSGFSIHAQVASIIAQQKLPILPYCCCRFFHGILSALLSLLLLIVMPDIITTVTSTLYPARSFSLIYGYIVVLPLCYLTLLCSLSMIIYFFTKMFHSNKSPY